MCLVCEENGCLPALARVFRFFNVHSLLCGKPVSLVEAMLALSQGFFVAHYFPSVEDEVGFADYLFARIAGDDKRVLFTVFAAVHNPHHIPSCS